MSYASEPLSYQKAAFFFTFFHFESSVLSAKMAHENGEILRILVLASLILSLQLSCDTFAIPMESDGHGRSNLSFVTKQENQTLTFSEQFGFDLLPAPSIEYGPLDFAKIISEDQTRDLFSGPKRIAIKRDLTLHARDGEWLRVPSGLLWRVEISCEASLGVNLHFVDVDLPLGAELIVYDVHNPSNIHGPFTEAGDFGTGEIWAVTVGTERICIEYFVPMTSHKSSNTLPFKVADLHDVYVDFLGDGNGRFGGMSCYEDPACHSEWDDVAKGMAQIIINNSGSCSGGLIATAFNDETPYYYTANHCVGSESEANSLTFFFGYQRVTCSGSVSNGTQVSGGADLVAASPNSQDGNTLVMIRREIPREIYFPGYTMSGISFGTNTTSLHFPASSWMRISKGDYVGADSLLAYQSWVPSDGHGSGAAEPGSSGSPIMRDSDQRIYGSLYGGAGEGGCGNEDTLAAYNRLSAAGFSVHLLGGPDDDYEDCDSCEDAYDLESGFHSGLIVKSTDEDWYRFSLVNGQTLSGTISFTDAYGDIDVDLYHGCGENSELVATSQSNGNAENISYTNETGESDDFVLRIYLDGWGTRNEYSINMASQFEGACCVGTDFCIDFDEESCGVVSGTWMGIGTSCSNGDCKKNPCPADINGDGVVGINDILEVISHWDDAGGASDVNDDGVVDVSDLLFVVDAWGDCS